MTDYSDKSYLSHEPDWALWGFAGISGLLCAIAFVQALAGAFA